MNSGDFFVMLNTPKSSYTPLMYDDYDIAKYESIEDAQIAAENNSLGETFGYEVFEIGCGV